MFHDLTCNRCGEPLVELDENARECECDANEAELKARIAKLELENSAHRAMMMLEPKEMTYSVRSEFERLKRADVEQGRRVAELLAEIEELKLRPPMACSTCEDWNLELADELRAIRPVFDVAARMRTFPVPGHEHAALVDAVDAARQHTEPDGATDEDFFELMRSMSRGSPCECNDWPHAPYCPARRPEDT